MHILTCPSKLQQLEVMLRRSLPQSLTVHGAVMHINRGNPAQHEVVVDSWPEFKVVLTRPQKQVMKDKWDFYANFYAAFYRDVDACRTLLENTEAIDWTMAFKVRCLQNGVYEATKDIAEARHVHLKPYSFLTALHPDPASCSQNQSVNIISWVPDGVREDLHFGTINSSHTALLSDTWSIGGNSRSLRYMDSLVCNFPSTGLFNKEGQLVAWCLSDPVGCLTHIYTHPQYRGKGCMETVVQGIGKNPLAENPVWPAMLLLTCPSKLQLLEGMLRRSLPQSLTVHGAVMHINRGNPAGHEVVVDSWPEFKVVLTRPQVIKDNWDFYANLYAAFYQDVDACRALLKNAEAIDWSKAFQLKFLQDGVYEAAKDIAEARHVLVKPYCYDTTLHPDPFSRPQKRLRDDLHFGTINSSHAALLSDTWSKGGNRRSLRYMDNLVRNFPSTGLFNKEGQLVSWSLSDEFGCLTHGYTHPQYRGQGCIEAVTQATARTLYAHGFPVYGGVLAENHPSRQSLKRQNFDFLPWTYYMLFMTPTLDPKNSRL
ncbi:hypothetical protein lerEdw1_003429 [Lerista edwardsae]|nr:hypothetical protein lerEdw1_003429 [Lerista edwardsae]